MIRPDAEAVDAFGKWIVPAIITADWVAMNFEEVIPNKINPKLPLHSVTRVTIGAVSRAEKGKESVP